MNMKKIVFLLMMAFMPFANLSIMAGVIPLQVGYIDPTKDQDPQRSPVFIPRVGIEDYTLSFITPCDGCELLLLDEDGNIAYSTIIPEGCTTLMLPSYLSGFYEIQIIRGNFCFYGYIEL